MKDLKIAALAALLTGAAATSLHAAPRLCPNKLPPTLSGDLFSPAECSTAAKTTAALPGRPVARDGRGVKTDLRELDGRWEGTLIHGLGRYELLLTVKSGWGGKAEVTLDAKELQFRERLTDRLTLVPAKERGVYEATLASSVVPDGALKGSAKLGATPPIAISITTATVAVPSTDRQADLSFANGAVHRVIFSVNDKELRVRAFSGIPGAPLQTFELALTKTKREAL